MSGNGGRPTGIAGGADMEETDTKTGRFTEARLIFALTIMVGLILSFAAFHRVRHWEELNVQRELDRVAAVRAFEIRNELETCFVVLESLRAFYHASREVERGEFHDFVEPLLRNFPGIQALEWIPRVPVSRREAFEMSARRDGLPGFRFTELSAQGERVRAAERSEYFPVYFLEPGAGNGPALGFDLASDPVRMDALIHAGRSGKPVATSRFRPVQEPGEPFGFLVFLPVYRKGTVADSPEERWANLAGFFLGVFRIGDIVENALAPLPAEGVDFQVEDLSAPEGERFLYYHESRWRTATRGPLEKDGTTRDPERQNRQTFQVTGRQWSVLCFPSPHFLAAYRTWQPFIVLLLGLFSTGLVAGFFTMISRSSSRLSKVNEDLRHEIRERKRAEADLWESEKRFRTLFQNAPVGIGLAEMGGGLVLQNDAMLRMFGLTPEEARESNAVDFYNDPQDRASILERVRSAGFVRDLEVRMRRKDGAVFHASMTMIFLSVGATERVLTVIEDITDRKGAEEALRSSEERFRAVFEGSIDAIFLVDPGTGRILSANPAASELLGRPHQEIVGLHQSQVHPPHMREYAEEAFERVVHQRDLVSPVQTLVLCSDGTEKPVEVQAHIIQIGGSPMVYGVFHDVTERTIAERALMESEASKRSILEAAPIGIGLVYDRVVGWVSERLTQMLGFSAEELLGKSARIYYESDEEFERVGRVKYGAIREKGIGEVETRWKRKDGRVIDVLLRSSPIDPEDLTRGVTYTALDITARKEAEKTLRMLETAMAQSRDGIIVVDHCCPKYSEIGLFGGLTRRF